jgi:hypothetical protein
MKSGAGGAADIELQLRCQSRYLHFHSVEFFNLAIFLGIAIFSVVVDRLFATVRETARNGDVRRSAGAN